MSRPHGLIVGLLALALSLGIASRPEASIRDAPAEHLLPLPPNAPLLLEGCSTVEAREEFEGSDCLQTVRYELLEGRIDLDEALARLESCAHRRADLTGLGKRAEAVREAEYRAHHAFGIPADSLHLTAELEVQDERRARLLAAASEISPATVQLLRRVGVTPNGIRQGSEDELFRRIRSDEAFRAAMEEAFGSDLVADFRSIVERDEAARPAAVVIGRTVVVPNFGGSGSAPIVTGVDAYSLRLASELRALEAARLRYFASAARANQETGSVRSFLAMVRRLGKRDAAKAVAEAQVEKDRLAMLARLHQLETRLGADRLIRRSAEESLGLAMKLQEECAGAATRRSGWIRTGAGLVTGLVAAAGVVVVTGATGTLIGGITIAAALEASVGAYFIARSEQFRTPVVTTGRLSSVLPAEAEERPFRRPSSDVVAETGEEGTGAGEFEEWFEDYGERQEMLGLAGEGIEDEEGSGATDEGPKENTIPPILPLDDPEELRELPPLLESGGPTELASLSLPEIQERLDEFLALTDPAAWSVLNEGEAVQPTSLAAMMAEAQAALKLWEGDRRLHENFGPFFVNAELERLPPAQRSEALPRALGRYLHDRDLFYAARDIDDLRERVASRLVTHCRAGTAAGDLVLTACTNETALSIFLIGAIHDAGVRIPASYALGVQAFGERFEAVLYSRVSNEVYSLTKGTRTEGVVAPIFYPASFYYAYLVSHNVPPEIEFDRHLLMALPNRAMPEGTDVEECVEERGGSVVGRAVEWIGSLVGVRKLSQGDCAGDSQQRGGGQQDGGVSIDLAMPMPRNPLQGGGQSGGGQGGGGGGGGGSVISQRGPRDASGGGADGAGSGGGGAADGAETGSQRSGQGQGSGSGQGKAETAGSAGGGGDAAGGQDAATAASRGDAGQGGAASESTGSGGSGGYGIGSVAIAPGPDLAGVGRETVRMAEKYNRTRADRVMPWRLREDEGMMTGSNTRVLYADNARALERFDKDDLFITLTPAEVEAQRRMLEADGFPIFPAATTCESPNLPPRRVFRREAAGEQRFRYVYCDQDESMVIFRDRKNADSYATLSPPDRPLYLARLAADRLESFQRSREVQRVQAFLADPNTLRAYSKDEIYAMVKAAADVLVFQNALESALVQSMNELGPSGIRSYYYDMHKQVLRAPFFVQMAQGAYRLNRRLASDPLQSLAWANSQPTLARRGFFDLYYNLGKMMEWPERWATLEARYGAGSGGVAQPEAEEGSLDFLQILSDPTRVRIDWAAERKTNPSIRDREMQEGRVRTPEPSREPTLSELLDQQEEEKHLRGGTGGLGRAGLGTGLGPEQGRRPLQMVRIRIAPDRGDPDREQLPDDNQVRPGGTEGEKRTQTEESASRQEAFLWVSPQTFVEAVISTWDGRDLEPESSGRIPPLLRFNERLRQVFLEDLRPHGVYDNRLLASMEVFTLGGWLQYQEVREALGGEWVNARARDTGRFSAAYAGNPPINDQDQIRIPNFFTQEGVTLPADLFPSVQEHYSRTILGIFELTGAAAAPPAGSLNALPVGTSPEAAAARRNLLRTLEVVRQQALAAE